MKPYQNIDPTTPLKVFYIHEFPEFHLGDSRHKYSLPSVSVGGLAAGHTPDIKIYGCSSPSCSMTNLHVTYTHACTYTHTYILPFKLFLGYF